MTLDSQRPFDLVSSDAGPASHPLQAKHSVDDSEHLGNGVTSRTEP